MSIYEELLKRGYSDEEIRLAGSDKFSPPTRSVKLAISDTPDGIPIVGIQYQCDYRYEEEHGIGDIYKALGIEPGKWAMDPKANTHINKFAGISSLIISTVPLDSEQAQWGQDIKQLAPDYVSYVTSGSVGKPSGGYRYIDGYYDQYYSHALHYVQRFPGDSLDWKTIAQLREIATSLGLTKLPRVKAAIINFIQSSKAYANTARQPNNWPGWFHTGRVLVLRADRGIVADTLELLYEAGKEGFLAAGGGRQAFGSGLSFYDGRDVGPMLIKERETFDNWLKEEEKALEPVAKELQERGYSWRSLGKPVMRENSNGEKVTHYWLQGNNIENLGRPSGYYTLEELLAEKFVEDLKNKQPLSAITN